MSQIYSDQRVYKTSYVLSAKNHTTVVQIENLMVKRVSYQVYLQKKCIGLH